LKRGGTAGTAPSLTAVTGQLTSTFTSLANITGAAVPYSLSIDIAEVAWNMVAPNANGRDLVRSDITFQMLDTVATPVTITLVNDQASYA
jgi:hypothetical protein